MSGTGAIQVLYGEPSINPDGLWVPDGMIKAYDDALAVALAAGGAGNPGSVLNSVQYNAAHTFALSDAGLAVEYTGAGAANFTIDTNANVAFPVGTIFELCQIGAGQVTIVAVGGVTTRSPGGKLKVGDQYGTVSFRQRAVNDWVIAGDLTA